MARIIYVEDDELVGELVRDILSAEGHAVGVIADGQAALKIISERLPDLVIMDAGLPTMGGVEVVAHMRRNLAMSAIPVLMLTGRRGAEDERIAFHTGVTDYLRKPFNPDELAVMVNDLIGQFRKETAPAKPLHGMG